VPDGLAGVIGGDGNLRAGQESVMLHRIPVLKARGRGGQERERGAGKVEGDKHARQQACTCTLIMLLIIESGAILLTFHAASRMPRPSWASCSV
jgi:hypothetical protein